MIFSRTFDRGQPIYPLQAAPDTDEIRCLEPAELHGVAASYIEAMRAVHPEGPYQAGRGIDHRYGLIFFRCNCMQLGNFPVGQ